MGFIEVAGGSAGSLYLNEDSICRIEPRAPGQQGTTLRLIDGDQISVAEEAADVLRIVLRWDRDRRPVLTRAPD